MGLRIFLIVGLSSQLDTIALHQLEKVIAYVGYSLTRRSNSCTDVHDCLFQNVIKENKTSLEKLGIIVFATKNFQICLETFLSPGKKETRKKGKNCTKEKCSQMSKG